MSKNLKMLIMVAAFALVMVGAVFVYNNLSRNIAPDMAVAMPGDEQAGEKAEDEETEDEEAEDEETGEEKTKAPDFTVFDADGNEVRLSDMLGTPVVLNFWASWCPPCVGEMPEFQELYAEAGDEIAFMMVNYTDGNRETKEKAEEYINGQGFTFPVYFDTEMDAVYTYGISAIPVTVFIDREGYIAGAVQGMISESSLRKGISLIQ